MSNQITVCNTLKIIKFNKDLVYIFQHKFFFICIRTVSDSSSFVKGLELSHLLG